MSFKLIIEDTVNGAIVTIKNHYDYNEGEECRFVYEFDGEATEFNGESNLERFQDMLYDIVDVFNINNSRHNKERIDIRIVHGDKYECKTKNCPICEGKE